MLYIAKTSLTGYKIGLANSNVYVGIPEKYFNNDYIAVKFGDETRMFHKKRIIKEMTFPDKYSPKDEYTLCYVLWENRSDEPKQTKLV